MLFLGLCFFLNILFRGGQNFYKILLDGNKTEVWNNATLASHIKLLLNKIVNAHLYTPVCPNPSVCRPIFSVSFGLFMSVCRLWRSLCDQDRKVTTRFFVPLVNFRNSLTFFSAVNWEAIDLQTWNVKTINTFYNLGWTCSNYDRDLIWLHNWNAYNAEYQREEERMMRNVITGTSIAITEELIFTCGSKHFHNVYGLNQSSWEGGIALNLANPSSGLVIFHYWPWTDHQLAMAYNRLAIFSFKRTGH